MTIRIMDLAEQAPPKASAQNPPGRHEQGAAVNSSARGRSGREEKEAANNEIIDVARDVGKIRAAPANFEDRQGYTETISGRYLKPVASPFHP